jgi:hypothetical protein
MKYIKWALLVVLLLSFVATSFARDANVFRLKVEKNQVIAQDVHVKPGKATIIEFPADVVGPIAIPDRSIFSCERKIPAYNAVICRPLVNYAVSTTAIVTTDNNEFILGLYVDDLTANQYDKYEFYYAGAKNKKQSRVDDINPISDGTPILNSLLNDFKHDDCNHKKTNDYLSVSCTEKITLGTSSYIKFSISSQSRQRVAIINVSVVIQTLGGFTGLSLKEEMPVHVEYRLTHNELRYGETIYGVLKVPQIAIRENQRKILYVHTDIGKEADIYLNKI